MDGGPAKPCAGASDHSGQRQVQDDLDGYLEQRQSACGRLPYTAVGQECCSVDRTGGGGQQWHPDGGAGDAVLGVQYSLDHCWVRFGEQGSRQPRQLGSELAGGGGGAEVPQRDQFGVVGGADIGRGDNSAVGARRDER